MTGVGRTTTSGGRLEMLSPGSKNRTQRASGRRRRRRIDHPVRSLRGQALAQSASGGHIQRSPLSSCANWCAAGTRRAVGGDLLRAPLQIEFLRYHRPQLQVVSETGRRRTLGPLSSSGVSEVAVVAPTVMDGKVPSKLNVRSSRSPAKAPGDFSCTMASLGQCGDPMSLETRQVPA